MKKLTFVAVAALALAACSASDAVSSDTNGGGSSTYKITFDAGGGTGTMQSLAFDGSTDPTLTANTFTYGDYTFAGWSLSSGGPVAYEDEEQYSSYSGNATLYARWKAGTTYVAVSFTTETNEDNSLTLTRYNGSDTQIVIPETISGVAVTAIGAECFRLGTGVTALAIPASVTSIGDGLLYYSNSLTAITIDGGNKAYTATDNVIFSKDGQILVGYLRSKSDTSYTIPSTVKTVGDYAFDNCATLNEVIVPASVASIGDYAFYNTGFTNMYVKATEVPTLQSNSFGGLKSGYTIFVPSASYSLYSDATYWEDLTLGKELVAVPL